MFRLRRFRDEVLRVERDRRRAHGPSLVVGLALHARGFRELVGTLAEKLAEKLLVLRGVLILGGAALTLLLLPALLRRLALRGRRALLRVLLLGRNQRLVLEDRVESRDDESRAVDLLLDYLRLAELLLGLLTQRKSKLLVPLRPRFIPRGGLEPLLTGDQLHLQKNEVVTSFEPPPANASSRFLVYDSLRKF